MDTKTFTELRECAEQQGSVTPEEIAEILYPEKLRVDAVTTWSVGELG